jgi:O-antigen ligase
MPGAAVRPRAKPERSDHVSRALLVVIAWGAIAFGAVYPWASVALAIGVLTCALVALRAPAAWRPGTAITRPLVALMLAVSLQLVPMPPWLADAVSPAAHDYMARQELKDPGAPSAPAGEIRSTAWRPISLRPEYTARALGMLVVLELHLLGASRQFQAMGTATVARGVIVLGLVLSLAAIVQQTKSPGLIYGWWEPMYAAQPFGPFVDRNHFAGWTLMAIPLAIGYWCALLARGLRRRRDLRNRLLWLGAPDGGKWMVLTAAIGAMVLALVMTMSRSGLLALASAVAISVWVLLRSRFGAPSRLGRLTTAVLITGLVGLAVVWNGLDSLGRQVDDSPAALATRVTIWSSALQVARDFPIAGTGLNTYQWVGYLNRTNELFASEAHNDYLQILSEGGALLGVPILVAGFLLARESRRRFVERCDDTMTYWLRVGAVTGLVAVGVQELAEFSLQMPGNAVLFTVLIAMAIAPQSSHYGRTRGRTAPAAERSSRGPLASPEATARRRERYALAAGFTIALAAGAYTYAVAGPYGAVETVDPRVRWETDPATGLEVLAFDASGDGITDHWSYSRGETLVRMDRDRNQDGRIDVRSYYDGNSRITRRERDSDHDGRFDRLILYNPDGTVRSTGRIQ